MIKATDWPVNLELVILDPLVNLTKIGPFLIFEMLIHLFKLVTGQYNEF